ncbi:MAG: PD40 domain-containing protein [Anaerolineae bacterium]|nr:PD40 domain-containing protein [Anaerolineae bacterium]
MTRILFGLIGIISLVCTMIILIALGVGRILPPEPELLFTASFNLRDLNIYRMSMSRQLIVPVTSNPANDFLADWSPDGEHIAFVSDRDGSYSIYVSDAQGNNAHRLIESSANQYDPVWSPDSRNIAFIEEEGGYGGVLLYDMASGTTQSLTDTYRTHVSPNWSPDGKSVTFVSDLDQRWNTKIYSVDIATHVVSPILVGSASNPVWSPDGRYMLYITGYEKVYFYLWDNTLGQSSLLYDGDFDGNDTPAWSADGRSIIFSAYTTGSNSAIFQLPVAACLARSADCVPTALTTIVAFYRQPHWKPTHSLSSQ